MADDLRVDDIVRVIHRLDQWAGVEGVVSGRVDRLGRYGVLLMPDEPLVRTKMLWFFPNELERTGRVFGRRTAEKEGTDR